jgi:hypothetical protein
MTWIDFIIRLALARAHLIGTVSVRDRSKAVLQCRS